MFLSFLKILSLASILSSHSCFTILIFWPFFLLLYVSSFYFMFFLFSLPDFSLFSSLPFMLQREFLLQCLTSSQHCQICGFESAPYVHFLSGKLIEKIPAIHNCFKLRFATAYYDMSLHHILGHLWASPHLCSDSPGETPWPSMPGDSELIVRNSL